MTKKNGKSDELHALKLWCDTAIGVIEDYDKSSIPWMSQFRKVVDSSYDRGSLKSLKLLKKDISEFLLDLPDPEKRKVQERVDSVNEREEGDFTYIVSKVLEKGKIESDEEYRVLESYIDVLLAEGKKEDVEKVNSMLSRFYKCRNS